MIANEKVVVASLTPCPEALIVTVPVAGVAVAATVRSIRAATVEPVSCAGAIVALTPVGRSEMASETTPL